MSLKRARDRTALGRLRCDWHNVASCNLKAAACAQPSFLPYKHSVEAWLANFPYNLLLQTFSLIFGDLISFD